MKIMSGTTTEHGSVLNADNKINIEIAERIAKGNKAYYANSKLIKSKLLKKNTKMRIYKTMIRPFVTYASETWTFTEKDKNNLSIFERQILRNIFGPVNIDNIWRIRNNMEIDKLIEGADIVRFIKAPNGWGISKEWTKQDQLGSYYIGNLWKPDQYEDQDNDGKKMSWKI
jgi:hypothetical protein